MMRPVRRPGSRRWSAVAQLSTLGIVSSPTMKRLSLGLAAVTILCAGCLPSPEGGFYWAHLPVTTSGDGLSYETAYHFHHVPAKYLQAEEQILIHDKIWAPQHEYLD